MTGALIRGIAMGSLYGVLAMAIALLHRTTGALSFAHGEIGGFAALVAVAAISAGAPWALAAAITIAAAAAIGATFELVVVRRIPTHRPMALTISTVGLLLLLIAVGQRLWGVYPRVLEAPLGAQGLALLGALIAPSQMVALATGVAGALGLTAVLQRTPIGLATIAAAHDRDEAALLGVPVQAITLGVWVVTSVLAAVAALLFGPVIGAIAPGTLTLFFLRSVVAVSVGGTTTMWGPVIGGIITGVVEQVAVNVFLPHGVPGIDVLAVLVLLCIAVVVRGRRPAAATASVVTT